MGGWVGGSVCSSPKNFSSKTIFTSEDAEKVRVRGKNSFDKIFFGEEEQSFLLQMIFGEKFISSKVESAKFVGI